MLTQRCVALPNPVTVIGGLVHTAQLFALRLFLDYFQLDQDVHDRFFGNVPVPAHVLFSYRTGVTKVS
jgi:hypothetical protein